MKFKVITAAVVVFARLPVAFSDESSSCGLRASHSLAREKSRVTSTDAGQTNNRLRHLLHQNIFDVGAAEGVSFGLRASSSSAKKKAKKKNVTSSPDMTQAGTLSERRVAAKPGKPYRVMKKKKGRSQMAEEECPCFSNDWSHEDYLDCIADAVKDFAKKTRVKIQKKAERSDCGKSVDEVCPCSSRWKNHKQYVSCITKVVQGMPQGQQEEIINQGEMSECGKNIEETCPCSFDWEDDNAFMLCITDAVQGLGKKKRVKILSKARKSHCGIKSTKTKQSRSTKTTAATTSSSSRSSTSSPDCNDENMCTIDTFDASEGKCVNTPIECEEGKECDPTDGICYRCGPPSGCLDATLIAVDSVTQGTTNSPFQLPASPIGCDESPTAPHAPAIWYKTIGDGNTFSVSTCPDDSAGSAGFGTQIAVYTSCEIIGVNSDACADGAINGPDCATGPGSTMSWPTVDGETYFIMVTGEGGSFELDLDEKIPNFTCRWKGMPPDTTTDSPPPLCGLDFTKVAICHYNEGDGQYEDQCVALHDAVHSLNNHPDDFCGRCDQLSFEEKVAEMEYLNMVMDTDFNDLAQFLNHEGKAIDELARFTSAVRNEIPVGMREAITDADIIRPLLKRHSDGAVVPSGRSLYEWENPKCASQLMQFVQKIIGVILAVIVLVLPCPYNSTTKVLSLSGRIAKELTDEWFKVLTAQPRMIWFAFKEFFPGSSASAWSGLEFVIYFDAIVKFLGNFHLGLIIKSIGGAIIDAFTPWDWLIISADLIITLGAAWATVGVSLGIKMAQFTQKLTKGAPVALAFLDILTFVSNWKDVTDVCVNDIKPLDAKVYCTDRLNVGTCEDLIIIENSAYYKASNPCNTHPKGMELVHQHDDSNGLYHCETNQRCCWRPTDDDPLPRCMVEVIGVDEVNGMELAKTDPELGDQVSGVVGYCTNLGMCPPFDDQGKEFPVFISDYRSSVIITPGRQSEIKEGSCTGCCLGEIDCSKEYQDGYTQEGVCIQLDDFSFCPYPTSSDICGLLSPAHTCCLQVKSNASLQIRLDPAVERFRVGVGYTFNFAAYNIQPHDPAVEFAWSFTNNVDDMTSSCCVNNENGRADHFVEHTFTTAGTYTLLAHVKPQNILIGDIEEQSSFAEQTMEMIVTAEDCPPTNPSTICTIFYTNGELESGECLTESDCNGAVVHSFNCNGFESECGAVGCCTDKVTNEECPPTEPPTTCTADATDDDRAGECLKVADCSSQTGKDLVPSTTCDEFDTSCGVVGCCVDEVVTPNEECPPTIPPAICLALDDSRRGECLKVIDCNGEAGKEVVTGSGCGIFGSECGEVGCCVDKDTGPPHTTFTLSLDCTHAEADELNSKTISAICASFVGLDKNYDICLDETDTARCPNFITVIPIGEDIQHIDIIIDGTDTLLVARWQLSDGDDNTDIWWDEDGGAVCISDQYDDECWPEIEGAAYAVKGKRLFMTGESENILYGVDHDCKAPEQCESNWCRLDIHKCIGIDIG